MPRTKMRPNTRQRPLYHESLEPRMLLATDAGWLFGVGGVDAAVNATAIQVHDSTGDVYVGGFFRGAADFDPGDGVAPSIDTGSSQGFVAKYNQNHEFQWVREIGGASSDGVNGLALDSAGNAYVTGYFSGTVTCGSSTLISGGGGDAFVAKLDSEGVFQWSISAGSVGEDTAYRIDANAPGSVYVTGRFSGTVDFGQGPLPSVGATDAFVAKLDSGNGGCLWAQGMGGDDLVAARDLAAAVDGSIYVSGGFRGTAYFGTTQAVPLVRTSAGYLDAFAAKLASDGSVLWVQQWGGTSDDEATGIAVDANHLYVSGRFLNDADFGGIALTSVGGADAFALNVDPADGDVLWARAAGGPPTAEGILSDVQPWGGAGDAVDTAGNYYVTGIYSGAVDFDPGANEALLVEVDPDSVYTDGFLWKLDADGDYVTAKRMGGVGPDYARAIALDSQDNLYWTGSCRKMTSATAEFPNGTLSLVGTTDTFVSQLPAQMLETHVVMFSDSFENGAWNGLWVQDSQKDWYTSTQRKTLGSYAAEVDGLASDATLTTVNPIALAPYGSAELTFNWYLESSFDAGEYLAVDFYNGTSWTEVARLRGDVDTEDVWHSKTIPIDATYLNNNFKFRFRASVSGAEEDANVDNVQLVATSVVGAPATLAISDVPKLEGNRGTTTFTFTVTRTGNSAGTLSVAYATANGTAVAGTDYTATSGTLSFAAGVTSKTISVSVAGDRTAEPNETFFVNLSNIVGGVLGDAQGVGTIQNDDGPALMAAFGEQTGGRTLTLSQVEQLMPVAVALWSTGSHVAVSGNLNVELDDLPPGQLGAAFDHTITLDRDANGAGWSVHRYSPATGQVDLLTVLSHEIGHVLGYDHSDNAYDLMAATLPLDARRLPVLGQVEMESIALGSLSLPTSTARQRVGLREAEPLMKSLPLSAAYESDFTLLLEPLAFRVAEQSNSDLDAFAAGTLADVADKGAALLEEDVLELIARAERQ